MKRDDTCCVWVIGANGMLGHDVIDVLQKYDIRYCATDVECDITNLEVLRSYALGKGITHIINCAAYTAVDQAEDEPEKAYALNALGPKNIACVSHEIGAQMVQISTDYVFDGTKETGYYEDDPVNPISVYGKTKAQGEAFVQENTDAYYIVRTAWLYGKHGKNFVYTMLRLMNERDEITVVNDQHGSPTYAYDLAEFIYYLITNDVPYGIYHYTNEGQTTWYEFAKEIYQKGKNLGLIKHECIIKPVATDKYPTKAIRPRFSYLLHQESKIRYKEWDYSLERFYQQYE